MRKEKVKFLGFSLCYYADSRRRLRHKKFKKGEINGLSSLSLIVSHTSEELQEITKKQKEKKKRDREEFDNDDFMNVRVNWRTVYKLTKHCCVCGSKHRVQMHHIKHVKKMGSILKGFSQIVASLNRKQIVVCKACHRKIHKGLYDGVKLSDFYDPGLASL